MIDREQIIKDFEHAVNKAHGEDYDYVDLTVEDADKILKLLKEREAEQSDWISVKERKPVEIHSIFWPLYGTKKWSNAMWREQSDKVLVTVEFKDGTRLVTTGETHDGVWHTAISRTLDPVVTHWMEFPELPEGVKWE